MLEDTIKAIGNISYSFSYHIPHKLIQLGILTRLEDVFKMDCLSKEVTKLALWTLSNLACSDDQICSTIINEHPNLIDVCVKYLDSSSINIANDSYFFLGSILMTSQP